MWPECLLEEVPVDGCVVVKRKEHLRFRAPKVAGWLQATAGNEIEKQAKKLEGKRGGGQANDFITRVVWVHCTGLVVVDINGNQVNLVKESKGNLVFFIPMGWLYASNFIPERLKNC